MRDKELVPNFIIKINSLFCKWIYFVLYTSEKYQ